MRSISGCSGCVTGRPSKDPIGTMPAPEPHTNAPSAQCSSIGQMSRSTASMPCSAAISSTVRRVIPGSAARVVGVTSASPTTRNRFAPVHSATAPQRVEHHRVVHAELARLLLGDDRVEVVERLHVRAERARRLAHDRAREELDRVGAEERRERIGGDDQRRHGAQPRVDPRAAEAAGDDRAHVRVAQVAAAHDLADDLDQRVGVDRQRQPERARRARDAAPCGRAPGTARRRTPACPRRPRRRTGSRGRRSRPTRPRAARTRR